MFYRLTRCALTLCLCSLLTWNARAADRAQEIMEEMWNSSDQDFKVTAIPQKWNGKSAVIIAQFHRFEYKKAAMLSVLRVNQYNHYRIKLIDKNAVSQYSEMSYPADEGAAYHVYVGYKVIKPNGKEIKVDLTQAVKMERQYRGQRAGYFKIAIPNLEPGDILDYYLCEEKIVPITNVIQFFDPVIHNLVQEYPVMKQKIQFRVQRRCFINLRSINGAPELKRVVDEANDEQYYSLEDGDRDGLSATKWLYPHRELPTIKFRAAYASGKGLRTYDVLLGKPGEVKNSVSKKELADLTATMMMVEYNVKDFNNHIKTNHKNLKDPFEISKAGYYYYRNIILAAAEEHMLDHHDVMVFPDVKFTDVFTTFLKSKKIPHDIVLTVPRHISSVDDVIFENEIDYLVRVKKGNDYIYFSPLTVFSLAGTLPQKLEGVDAYALDGLTSPSKWVPQRITLPVSTSKDNLSQVAIHVQTADLPTVKISNNVSLTGYNKLFFQHNFLDVYDAIEEDNKEFKKHESFKGASGAARKKYEAAKQAHLSGRQQNRLERLKTMLQQQHDFSIKDIEAFSIEQSGRSEKAPEVKYAFEYTAEDILKKTGPNYLVDIGKLIEKQVKVEGEELTRDFNIYFDNPRAYSYTITMDIPKGYQVQGLDKFNIKVEHKVGGFTSKAREENGKVIIETHKHYDGHFASKEDWKKLVEFLNAANTFTEQKILLKKK